MNTFIFNIILAPIMIYLYNGIGLAVAVVFTQIFHVIYLLFTYGKALQK